MKLILLERIHNLGKLGDQVNVKPGFGRNYLLPQGKAIIANAANVKIFESRRAELEQRAIKQLTEAQQRAKSLENMVLTIPARVSEEQKLYGSIGATEIAAAIKDQGLTVKKQEVLLPSGPIRTLGEFDIRLLLLHDFEVTIKLSVVPLET